MGALTALATLLVAPPPVSAFSPGAQVYHQCQTDPGYSLCIDLEYNYSFTPSGVETYESNGSETFSITTIGPYETTTDSGQSRFHFQDVLVNGVLQEEGSHTLATTTDTNGVFTTNCIFLARMHYANGTVQYADLTFTCTTIGP